ncbi:hypothetical protein QRD90_18175 [Peribacillus frigoritolerans]|uniref:hypothetical protein n=1 Tax=Peribacillus frigoritolerans TaxID=450367 RepID=UPI0025711EC6|nr:hypothetical protein [Peribacillus frigoritolerans]WJE46142.1 hypothetical protein QRD90_18175 [Peribacillus frigoritolerans]
MKEIEILVISQSEWNVQNNTGNTYSNIFGNLKGYRFSSLYCNNAEPDNEVCNKYFKINEKEILLNLFGGKNKIGKSFNKVNLPKEKINNSRKKSFLKRNKNIVFYTLRELIWKIGNWKNKNLAKFIDETSPDIIFMTVHGSCFMHNMLKYVKGKTNARVVLFFSDDYYSYNTNNKSPLYYINRFFLRKRIRESVKIADLFYGASDMLCEEYGELFKVKIKPLYKGCRFDEC